MGWRGSNDGEAAGAAHALNFSGYMDDEGTVGGCRHPSALAHERMANTTFALLRGVLAWT